MKDIFNLMLLSVGFNFFISPLFGLGMPFLYNQILNTDALYFSLTMVLLSVGSITMSVILINKKQSNKIFGIIYSTILIWILVFIIQGLNIYLIINKTISFPVFFGIDLLIMFFIGILLVRINTPVQVTIQQQVEPVYMGRVFSVIQMLSGSLAPIAVALAGIFLDKFPFIWLFIIITIGFILTSLLGIFNKELRKL